MGGPFVAWGRLAEKSGSLKGWVWEPTTSFLAVSLDARFHAARDLPWADISSFDRATVAADTQESLARSHELNEKQPWVDQLVRSEIGRQQDVRSDLPV
jgi:hypothetical protein